MRRLSYGLSILLFLLPACSDDNGTEPLPTDTTPPDIVDNLTAAASAGGVITLRWNAPGDDGYLGQASLYDIRFMAAAISEGQWDNATPTDTSMIPKEAGRLESLELSGFTDGVWYFAIKTADEVPNWSDLSNVASAFVGGVEAPSMVTDLAIGWATPESAILTWTAPDSGSAQGGGAVVLYDLRYDTDPITDETWSFATQVPDVDPPGGAGTAESFAVTGLVRGTTYFFAMKCADETPTWSDLSNVTSVTTGSPQQLTYGGTGFRATAPTWSPNGEQIAFSANWTGDWEVYRIPVGYGEQAIQLTDDPGHDTHAFFPNRPAWSPDGQKIAFVSDRGGGESELWVMNADDGSSPALLAGHEGFPIQSCAWSPDGTQIVYQAGRLWSLVSPTDIYLIPSAGGTPALLISSEGEILNYDPAWSPDGTRIVYGCGRNYRWEIWQMPVDGGNPIRLLTEVASIHNMGPCYSPDGARIAIYSNRRSDDYNIWTMSDSGGDFIQLTTDEAWDESPAWSPDGGRIAFASNRGGSLEIWILWLD
ncbi:MAG: hypothetical protein KJ970_17200 [Candidatus Eisenbacteria bacterium]|uniref:Fibronectin type-III domain-containing protein n=1 Tax=Eiseniibacteriota bacterium TaxID=2212470 RepID=A0A948RXG9_UNCEI|nr:hypothetical protein [Candidatus Eisenbacteria bacterium]MBU1948686.1 hypothetical protein [Candidatus Eisenbacteria bacterium]MBU2692655.1 hypothetical protein [Candidatus Eisenbacteria bacterium]